MGGGAALENTMTMRRAMSPCAVFLAAVQVAAAALPDAAEYSRVVKCFSIDKFVDLTSPATKAEELPPCVAACPPGTEAVTNQCVWPESSPEELRLRFELFERCQQSSCPFFGQWDAHLKVVGMKVAQLLGIPMQELREAMIFWSVDTWPLPESSPRLQKFLISRRDEEDFPRRRASTSSADPWYLLHMSFRVDSSRISHGSLPVQQLAARDSESFSEYLGIQVEVRSPEAYTNKQSTGETFSQADYRAVYQFEGFGPNQNPFDSATTTPRVHLQDGLCHDPCFFIDEQAGRLGAHRCASDCDCFGERRCSEHGYCIGNTRPCSNFGKGDNGTEFGNRLQPHDITADQSSSFITTTAQPTLLPGYQCIKRSGGVADASGASRPMTTLRGCAAACNSAPTCRAFEWHVPDHCFLITHSVGHRIFLSGSEDGSWYICGRLSAREPQSANITTIAGVSASTVAASTTMDLENLMPLPLPREGGVVDATAATNEVDPDAPGWYLWLAGLGLPLFCCAGIALKFTWSRKPPVVLPTAPMHKPSASTLKVQAGSFSKQKSRDFTVNAAQGWGTAADTQGAAEGIPLPTSAFGAEALRREHWSPPKAGAETSTPSPTLAKSWSERLRTDALRQLRRTRPLFADEERPPSAQARAPKRRRSAPPSTDCRARCSSSGAMSGQAPHFSTAWEGSYGAHARASNSGSSHGSEYGHQRTSDAAADDRSMPAGGTSSQRSASRSAGPAACARSSGSSVAGDSVNHTVTGNRSSENSDSDRRGNRSSENSDSDRRPKSAEPVGRSSGRVRSPLTPPPPRAQHSQPTRVEQLAEDVCNNESDVAAVLSPTALALELARLRESTLVVRRRFFMAQCLRWHPDKNAGCEQHATRMFQVLQEKKEWFLSDG